MITTNVKEFFEYLNRKCKYLVLRNWQGICDDSIYSDGHEDIDILCDDLKSFLSLSGAQRIHKENNRDNFMVLIGNHSVRFDVRWIGDGYYPIEFEQLMLEHRVLNQSDIYVPSLEDYFYSLAYHALIQKPDLSSEYKSDLNKIYASFSNNKEELNRDQILNILRDYLNTNGFEVVLPKDPGVFFNNRAAILLPNRLDKTLQLKRRIFRIKQRLLSYLKV